MRRSFLDNMPSAETKMNDNTRKSPFENDNQEPQAPKRASIFDTNEKTEEPKRRGSFMDSLPEKPVEQAPKKERGSFADTMPASAPKKPVAPQPAIHSGPRNSLFHEEDLPVVKNSMQVIQNNFAEFYNVHERRLHSMVTKLVNPSISTISGWGEKALDDQKNLVNRTANIVKEFNTLNGNQLLDEIIASAGYRKEKSFFEKIKNSFSSNEVNYAAQVESLQVHLKALMPIMDDLFEKSKDSLLPLWMVSLSGFADSFSTDDKALEMAIDSRRKLLQHAFINVKSAHDQLDIIRVMAVQMLTQSEHVMNVTIPAMLRSQ